jgi:hypothetical protein
VPVPSASEDRSGTMERVAAIKPADAGPRRLVRSCGGERGRAPG